jgi:hypothetical protein
VMRESSSTTSCTAASSPVSSKVKEPKDCSWSTLIPP